MADARLPARAITRLGWPRAHPLQAAPGRSSSGPLRGRQGGGRAAAAAADGGGPGGRGPARAARRHLGGRADARRAAHARRLLLRRRRRLPGRAAVRPRLAGPRVFAPGRVSPPCRRPAGPRRRARPYPDSKQRPADADPRVRRCQAEYAALRARSKAAPQVAAAAAEVRGAVAAVAADVAASLAPRAAGAAGAQGAEAGAGAGGLAERLDDLEVLEEGRAG